MKKQGFNKTPLATGIALALGTLAPPALAQDDARAVDEIVVTGIRGSLKASMDIKRDAYGVVDAINAEDMGDFPDTNLAESLQRITGVSIDRERGEGSRVTVRGFGPNFNLVLLNGRQMPTTSGLGRSFDFGNLASEGISSVEIYKSGRADVPTGGIGSTINIKTTRPLDAPGFRTSVSASGVYDESTTSSASWTPEISALFSNTFADDRIGVALTAVRQDRESGAATANVGGWRTFPGEIDNCFCGGPSEWGGIPPEGDPNQLNRPGAGDLYSVPQAIGYELASYDRVRTNGQLTLQFRPVDSLTATLDYTYSEFELDRTYNNLSAWFNFGGQETEWADGPQASPIEYTENSSGSDFSMGAGADAFRNQNNSAGLNLLWNVSDRLSLELDYHDSSARNEPNSPFGNSALLSIAAWTRDRTSGYFGQELPVLEVGLSNPLSADDMQVTGSVFANEVSRMDIEQLRAGGSMFFDASFVESIDFGVQLTDVDNRAASAVVQRDSWSNTVTPLGAIEDLMEPASIAGAFDEVSGGGDPRLQTDFFTYDMEALIERTESLMDQGITDIFVPGNGDLGPCGTALCPTDNFTADRRTLEESQSAYVQVNMATEWGDKPVSMRLGLRYEQTDVTSRALSTDWTGLNWVAGNELSPVSSGGNTFTQLEGDYDYWLPNFDFRMDFAEGLVGRVSLSKTLTRPDYGDIQGGLTINSPVRITEGTGNRGNPALLPFESENLDLSLEYYYGDASYVAAGYFRKDVDNFIGTASVTETVFDLPHPALGPLGEEARAATGSSEGGVLYSWILDNRPDAAGVDEVNGVISGVEGRDPSTPFNLTVPVNIEKATMDGWEVVVQHNFWDTGFGLIANATIVDADVGYDNLSLEQQFVLTGLSDSANFIAFYDKDGIGVRLAYNWRDDFLAGTGQVNVGAGPPSYVADYEQWDLNASYWYNDNLQLFVDVLNLTDETSRVYGRDEMQTLFATQLGTRYNLGVRYKF